MLKIYIHAALICSMLLFAVQSIVAQNINHSQIRVQLSDELSIHQLQHLNLDIDHPDIDKLNGISFFAIPSDLDRLKAEGIDYEILIDNYEAYYIELLKNDLSNVQEQIKTRNPASHFGYGSMGGFYTLTEIEGKLDEMSNDFPSITTSKYSIGTSIEGRTIWAMKISDNPNVDEDEPAVYFDALHHCREPLSMAVSINYMFWLLENYASDPAVQYLVNNREIYFVPCVNPDGYEYNRQTNPTGGGLWRKNRKDNGDGCFGVDLNRNYSFEFGHDNACASDNPCSTTYKGAFPFSEPETQATRDFIDTVQPQTAFSVHSTAGSYLMPYGYNMSPPAYAIYSQWASDFLSENNYPYGTTFLMLGYTSCGTTRDYFHSENIYGWTPEIDGSGFWPAPSEIFDLVDENVYPLYYQSWIAGAYANFKGHELSGAAVPDSTMDFSVTVINKGVGDTATNITVTLLCSNPHVTITGNSAIADLAPRETGSSNVFQLAIGSAFDAANIMIEVVISQDGVQLDHSEILIPAGHPNVLFFDDAESGMSNWSTSGFGINWSTSDDDAYNGNQSFADSDNGNSENNTINNNISLASMINLSSTASPQLEFYSKWSVEDGDEVLLQASTTGGILWETIKTFTNAESWHQELISLDAYKSSLFSLRFSLSTDNSIPSDGFYFDDLSITDYNCPDCPVCIVSTSEYPASESFESGLGSWVQDANDDIDWTRNMNATPTANTGPSAAYAGDYYLFVESSLPSSSGNKANLVSPCLNFDEIGEARLDFRYHMFGTATSMELAVEISLDAGTTWSSPIWSMLGNQGDQWLAASIDLSTYTDENVMLRIAGTVGESDVSDIAIDDINIYYCPTTLHVNRNIIANGTYRAASLIISGKRVPANGNVLFRSGSEVDLNPSFETELGGQFEAIILDCFD